MTEHWRVLPWDPQAPPGEPLSPSFVPGATGRGRFDLPVDRSPVLYLAESPEHAVAEALQPWRNRPLRSEHLERAGLPLALVRVRLPDDAGHGGLRWWSTFWGDWHGVVLFTERIASGLTLDEPETLSLEAPAVRVAAEALGMAHPTGAE